MLRNLNTSIFIRAVKVCKCGWVSHLLTDASEVSLAIVLGHLFPMHPFSTPWLMLTDTSVVSVAIVLNHLFLMHPFSTPWKQVHLEQMGY